MRKFSRYWTLELETDIDDFRAAFKVLVRPSRNEIILPGGISKPGRDYFGELQGDRFDLCRRDDIFARSNADDPVSVNGKMAPGNGTLNVELKILKSSAATYVKIFAFSVIGSPIASLLLNGLLNTFSDSLTYTMPDWLLITELVVMFAAVFYGLVKLEHYYLDRRVKDFTRVIKAIEELSKK